MVAPVSRDGDYLLAPRAGNQYKRNGFPKTQGLNDWERGKYNVFTPHKADHVNTSKIQLLHKRVPHATLIPDPKRDRIQLSGPQGQEYLYDSSNTKRLPRFLDWWN